jgi:hypothetical protein
MSRREDILSCIDVTIMDRFARTALPSAYSKIFPAFGAGAAITHAAGLGGKRFIDFIEPHSCVIAFVPKHGSKRTPPRIEHGLRVSSLCKGASVHIADKNRTVVSDQSGAELMQEVLPAVRNLGVNRTGTGFLARPLCSSKLGLEVAIESLGLNRRHVHVAKGRELSQAEVNADARNRSIQDRFQGRSVTLACQPSSPRHTDIQIPAPTGIFAEVTGTQFKVLQAKTIPEREPASREVDLAGAVANGSDLERNPSQRAARAAAFAPSEPDFPVLPAASRVFFCDLLHRLHGQIQGALPAGSTFQKRPKIKAGQKAPFALEHLDRELVTVVEDRVDLAGQRGKPRSMLVFDPHAQDPNGGRSSMSVHTSSLAIAGQQNTWKTALNTQKCATLSLAGLNAGVSRGERG